MRKTCDMKARTRDICIIFDCNDTLIHKPDTARIIRSFLKSEHRATVSLTRVSDALRTIYERRKLKHPRFTSESGRREFYITYNKELCAILGFNITDTQALSLHSQLRKAHWKLFSDVLPILRYYRKKENVSLGVIANWTATLELVLREVGIRTYFDFVYSSHELGKNKPNPSIFKEALNRTEKKCSNVYYVGDDYELDVVCARAVGITPILIDRENRYVTKNDCIKVKSLKRLKDVIK